MNLPAESVALLEANGLGLRVLGEEVELWSPEQPKGVRRLSLHRLHELLDGRDDGAVARGMAFALAAPCLPAAFKFDFAGAAATITSLLDTPAFARGFNALSESPATAWPLNRYHTLYFVFEGRDRRFAVTEALRAAWMVEEERVERAAASMLLHRTRVEFQPVQGASFAMERAFHNDGADAARLTILATHLFDRARKGLMIAAPTPDHLFVAPLDRSSVAAFATAAFNIEETRLRALPQVIYLIEAGTLLTEPLEWVASERRFA